MAFVFLVGLRKKVVCDRLLPNVVDVHHGNLAGERDHGLWVGGKYLRCRMRGAVLVVEVAHRALHPEDPVPAGLVGLGGEIGCVASAASSSLTADFRRPARSNWKSGSGKCVPEATTRPAGCRPRGVAGPHGRVDGGAAPVGHADLS